MIERYWRSSGDYLVIGWLHQLLDPPFPAGTPPSRLRSRQCQEEIFAGFVFKGDRTLAKWYP